MTFDEFITLRNIKIKDAEHERIVKLFYPYLKSVFGDKDLLPSILENILGIDLTGVSVITGCFNGINDNTKLPYNNVDFYIRLSNNMKVFIYGRKHMDTVYINNNEYVVFVTSDRISDNIVQKENRHIFIQ